MRVLLIVVIFNFEKGSELETRMDLTDMEACHAAAAETFSNIDDAVEIREMEILEGQEMLEGTMIAYGADGGEIGMYVCNILRATTSQKDG